MLVKGKATIFLNNLLGSLILIDFHFGIFEVRSQCLRFTLEQISQPCVEMIRAGGDLCLS